MTKRLVFLVALGLGVSLSGLLAGPLPVDAVRHDPAQADQGDSRPEAFDLRSWAAYHDISVRPRNEGPYIYCMREVGGCVTYEAASLLHRELFHRTGNRFYLQAANRIHAEAQTCSKGNLYDLCIGFRDLIANDGCTQWFGKSGSWCELLRYSMGDRDCYDAGYGGYLDSQATQDSRDFCAGIRAVLRHQPCDDVKIDQAQYYCRALYPIFYPGEGKTGCYLTSSYLSRLFSTTPQDICEKVKNLGLKEYYEVHYQP